MSELDHLREEVAYLKHLAECWYSGLASKNRAAHFEDQGVIAMELIAAIAMFGVVLVIVGVALDAARRAK